MTTKKDKNEINLEDDDPQLIYMVDQGLAELDNNPLLVLELLEEFPVEKE